MNDMSEGKRASIKKYTNLVHDKTPKSKLFSCCIKAFLVGGAICALGQGLTEIYNKLLNFPLSEAGTLTSVTLVFLTALLTGIGIFDKLGKFAGAGTLVPITGFANAMVSPAMEFTPEGFILGTGAKLFSIAGPVLVFGISASVIVGLVFVIFGL